MELGTFALRNPSIPCLLRYVFTIPAFFVGRKSNERFGANASESRLTPDAITAIYQLSHGMPRLISHIASECVLVGHAHGA
ncbi:MAG: hypothetical protein VB144_04910 [Clostridia bacterium]|nr:hypothetical protein [Clostridia bacterium]